MCLQVIDAGFPRLRVLELPPDAVELSVFQQACPGLPETERNTVFHALAADAEHPIVMAGTCLPAGFAADNDLLHPCA